MRKRRKKQEEISCNCSRWKFKGAFFRVSCSFDPLYFPFDYFLSFGLSKLLISLRRENRDEEDNMGLINLAIVIIILIIIFSILGLGGLAGLLGSLLYVVIILIIIVFVISLIAGRGWYGLALKRQVE